MLFEEILKEDKLSISAIKIGFKGIVAAGTNYVDSHSPVDPFGTRWGRGLIVKGPNYSYAISDTYGSTHSQLKKMMTPGEQTNGTYYYGYYNKTLYFDYGSDRTFDFNNGHIMKIIMDALKVGPGPLKGFIIR